MSEGLKFASPRIEAERSDPRYHATLRLISDEYHAFLLEKFNHVCTITCIFRTPVEDKALNGSGIHCVWRAEDERTLDMPPGASAAASDYINSRWRYDPSRPYLQVAYDKPHGTGPHCHIQVSAATKRLTCGD